MRKKLFISFLLIACLAFSVPAPAQMMELFHFPFIGKWQPAEDPVLIDDYGFQDIQNLRKDGKHLKGVSGHTKINTTALATYPYILSGFHFHKDQPAESHMIVYGADAFSPTNGRLYQNTTAIPSAGDFSATALYTPTYFNNLWRFSMAPAGAMVASNGDETLIWSGNETEATAFITSSAEVTYITGNQPTNANDYTYVVNNTRQTTKEVATLKKIAASSLLHFDGTNNSTTFADESGITWTAYGNAKISTSQFKWGTASGSFDGTNSYISAAANNAFRFSADFTVDCWVYFNSVSGSQVLLDFRLSGASANGFVVYLSGGNLILYSGGATVITGAAPSINNWYHLAFTRNGSNVQFFVNGTQSGSTWSSSANFSDGSPTLGIDLDHASNKFNGYLDELRIKNTNAAWSSNFSLPSGPYTNDSNYFLIGVKRPLQGSKFYVSSGNSSTSSLTVKEWNGASWNSLSITDGTASGGKTLAQTGWVTWPSTVSTSKIRYISGLALYWYQFYFDAGQSSIYYVTVDAPIQPMQNIWDGSEEMPAKFLKYDGTTYVDYTAEIEDESLMSYADLSSLTTSGYLLLGFTQPQQAFDFTLVPNKANANAAATVVYYWNGSNWIYMTTVNDATVSSGKSLNQGGVMSFQGNEQGTEFPRAISDEYPLYYYKIAFSANLSANTQIGEIRGVPMPRSMAPFSFSETFQNRLFLFNEKSGVRNKAIYSVNNAPDIFNGIDSGDLFFGDSTDLISAAVIYNVFSVLVVEQLIVTKKNETWRVSGDSPDNWVVMKMSENIGNVAPLSMVTCDITDVSSPQNDVKRSVALWVSDKGPVMSDGANIYPIYDDIKCYWDPTDSRYIPASMQTRSVGWYDIQGRTYKLLIASGPGATYLNTELEYSLKYREWTKIYREAGAVANPIQSGWNVFDINGPSYTYGGGKDGYTYRLENGNTWDGTAITQYVQTKDLMLDPENQLMRHTTANYIRLLYKKKSGGATEKIAISHYGDRVLTVSGTNNQYVPPDTLLSAGPIYTHDCTLGPFLLHSFKFTSVTSTVAGGQELLGFGLYFQPYQTIISN